MKEIKNRAKIMKNHRKDTNGTEKKMKNGIKNKNTNTNTKNKNAENNRHHQQQQR